MVYYSTMRIFPLALLRLLTTNAAKLPKNLATLASSPDDFRFLILLSV